GSRDFSGLNGPKLKRELIGFAHRGSEFHCTEANVQDRYATGLIASPTHPYFECARHRLPGRLLPQALVLILEFTIMPGAHQQVYLSIPGSRCLDEQFVKVTLAVGDVDQHCLWTQRRQRLASAQTLHPFVTFFLSQLAAMATGSQAATAACAYRVVQKAKRLACRRDGQRRVQKQADGFGRMRADWTQTLSLGMGRIIQSTRILQRQ